MTEHAGHGISSLDLPDGEFIARFERGGFSGAEFPHRAHLRMAWLYVRELGPDAAIDRAAGGIRNLAEANGQANLYHDTLTRAWVYLVALAAEQSPSPTFAGFIDAHPELLDKQLLLRHYSPDVLGSPEARARWVAPDLLPIPGAPSSRAVDRSAVVRVDPATYAEAFRAVPTAVAVVSANDGVSVHAMTASSVTSLSLEPPLVLVCVQSESRIRQIIRTSRYFGISFLSDRQRDLAPRFASRQRPSGAAQLHGVPHHVGRFGVPILDDVSAWLECELWSEYPGGDHAILCGLVTDAGAGGAHPLLSYARQLL
jgi:flavin reductase (DIM6/NTAB) family NADH-FMN oxidoreductase RutF